MGNRFEGLASRKGNMAWIIRKKKVPGTQKVPGTFWVKLFGGKAPPLFSRDVACAVIWREGKILIARRPKGSHLGGLWEFPGGKCLGGESLGGCLERESWGELGVKVRPLRFLMRIDHMYPAEKVSLYFYECALAEGNPWPKGCPEFRWVRPFELRDFEFPPADTKILRYRFCRGQFTNL